MKVKLLAAVVLLTFSTLAIALPVKPAKCPSASSLAAVGLNKNTAARDKDGFWAIGIMKNKYDTRDPWTFVIGRILANNPNEAHQKASAILNSLSYQQGPRAIASINRWGCDYTTNAGYTAIAVTPNLEGISLASAAHMLK